MVLRNHILLSRLYFCFDIVRLQAYNKKWNAIRLETTMNTKENKLTKKHLIGYTFGDLGECMTFSIMGSFLTRYYINVALIDTALLAVLTLVWKIADAISNPLIGMYIDKMYAKKKYKAGKFRVWMLRMTPLLAITAIIVFTAPNYLDGMSKLVVVFVSYLSYTLIYNMFSIPYGSLLTAMSNNEEERAKLSSARGMGGMFGSMIPSIFFPIIITAFSKNPQLGYGLGVTICAAVGFVLCLLSYFFTEERCGDAVKEEVQDSNFTDIFDVARKNRAFMALAIHGVFQGITQAINMSMGTYMFTDVLGSMSLMSISSICILPFTGAALVCSPYLVKKMGTMKLIRGGLVIGTGVYLVLFAMHVLTNVNPMVHILMSAVGAMFTGVGTMMQWGLVGETIDYNEYLLGKRSEGTIYGTFNMLRRLGQAIGTSGSVALLGWIGYDVALSNAGLAQSAETVFGIKVLCVLVPAIVTIGSWLSFKLVWNITPELKEKMLEKNS